MYGGSGAEVSRPNKNSRAVLAMHALLCGTGHNLRMILAQRRVLYCAFMVWLAITVMSLTAAASLRHRRQLA